MRRLDKLVAFKVRPFESFGPIAMHDSIEHYINPGKIAGRFKDGRVFQERENAREVDLQSRRKTVVDVERNPSLVSFLHQGGVLLNALSPAHSGIVDEGWLCGRSGDDF